MATSRFGKYAFYLLLGTVAIAGIGLIVTATTTLAPVLIGGGCAVALALTAAGIAAAYSRGDPAPIEEVPHTNDDAQNEDNKSTDALANAVNTIPPPTPEQLQTSIVGLQTQVTTITENQGAEAQKNSNHREAQRKETVAQNDRLDAIEEKLPDAESPRGPRN